MRMLVLQPAPETDGISEDGHEFTKLPWPIAVAADPRGTVVNAEIYGGQVERLIGFQRDLSKQQLDVRWHPSIFLEPEKLVGLYAVTEDRQGLWGVHQTAIMSAEVKGDE